MFNKENFVEASFIDNERKNIEVLTKSDDGKSVIPTIIPFDETNHMFKELMDIKTLDELHEDTHNKKKLEGELYKEQAIAFAKESGLVAEENKSDIVTSALFKIEAPITVCQTPFLFEFLPVNIPALVGEQVVPTW